MNLSGKRVQGLLGLGALVVVLVVGLLVSHGHATHSSSTAATVQAGTSSGKHAPGVPARAYQTLTEIDAGRWPGSADAPGTKGGDQWMNRGGSLPRTASSGKSITYREWDVNPKQPGHTRDAQRIITGSDGSAYYTGDHYQTFTRMR
ncbi:ribonuclease domain-containing protein [Nocardia alni]|uniref:ribonuclease domain-containing protein n=1 Tax=Nocardia alni TaxID=2815723 RepID=UPI001C24CC9B|nr:ribonuclease domain-containing protein [Nocardia alni]